MELQVTDASFRFSTEERIGEDGEKVEVLKDEVVVLTLAPVVLSRHEYEELFKSFKRWSLVVEPAKK